ncbi:T9SS type A sorting domain-containing protein [Emticicia sp. CRIBPO]|uniref:T9SS type A sorting domain-containing protein n=1 Tax=Emticicia sp. CRIBPO TaxID=2683258 RepID=UPI00141325B3|nr:T9SS type A sorting domain-containing protein [Emticicia sp. CRIBPO]NBA89216.1 T9SS type A sorting domain-containing protein [Emticicia sp. CRIBPO]
MELNILLKYKTKFGLGTGKTVLLSLLCALCSFSNYSDRPKKTSAVMVDDDNCQHPTYILKAFDVSDEDTKDGRLIISEIYNATHYEIIESNSRPFNFKNATPIDPLKREIEINNIANPAGLKEFKVRLYNGSENCFSEQTTVFEHVNFAKNFNYSAVEISQGVDNSAPALDGIVTFTTVIQNKGSKTAENVEVRLVMSSTLESVNFYADKGTYSSIGNIWTVGQLKSGQSGKVVIRAKVKTQGLSYVSSFISRQDDKTYTLSELQASVSSLKKTGTSCVSVPISIKNDEVYSITLKEYKGVKWFFKDPSGNFSEITDQTNPGIASINKDSSLTIKQSGEYTFSKKVGECNVSSCCPIIVESCEGPPIIVDSVYCNTTVDSYNIIVHMENDSWSIIEKVYFAMANLSFPVLTNYLERINALPLSSSSGFVTSLGNGKYMVENIPAFMPNVTLVSTDISGKCRNVKIVNAPNCSVRPVSMPNLTDNTKFLVEGQRPPSFSLKIPEKGLEAVWFNNELGVNPIHVGSKFTPTGPGTFYVAYRDRKTKALSLLVPATVKELKTETPGTFKDETVCACDNAAIVPQGDLGDVTIAKAYPNPVSELLTVDYRLPANSSRADLIFYNVNGRQMAAIELNKNEIQIKVETNNWADGTYVYQLLIDGKKSASQKIIVLHN